MKQKSRLLIVMMLLSLSCFSQKNLKTQVKLNNDSVKIHKDLAIKIAKDLEYLTVLKEEKVLLLENIDTLLSQKKYKDTIILNKNKEIKYSNDIISLQKAQQRELTTTIGILDRKLKVQKITKSASIALLILTVGFAIIK
jgi:hypothetical protein